MRKNRILKENKVEKSRRKNKKRKKIGAAMWQNMVNWEFYGKIPKKFKMCFVS